MNQRTIPLLFVLLAACSAEPPVGSNAEPLRFQVATPIDAGPSRPNGPTDYLPPPQICWWDPEPQEDCHIQVGREPTCPTCFRWDYGSNQIAYLKANMPLNANLADHVVVAPDANNVQNDHAFVSIDPQKVLNDYQFVLVPPQYANSPQLRIWFVVDTDVGSYAVGPGSLPKF